GPWVKSVYPLGGTRGTDLKCNVSIAGADRSLTVKVPENAPAIFEQRFEIDGRLSNPVLMATDTLAEKLEQEPNDATAQGLSFSVPSMLNGRIDKPADVDVWSFDAEKGKLLTIEMQAARLGSSLQALVAIQDANGKEL